MYGPLFFFREMVGPQHPSLLKLSPSGSAPGSVPSSSQQLLSSGPQKNSPSLVTCRSQRHTLWAHGCPGAKCGGERDPSSVCGPRPAWLWPAQRFCGPLFAGRAVRSLRGNAPDRRALFFISRLPASTSCTGEALEWRLLGQFDDESASAGPSVSWNCLRSCL